MRSRQSKTTIAVAALCSMAAVGLVFAAETELVGVLALAIEPEVAERLELSEEQVLQLRELTDDREMKGISRAMKLAKLPRREQVAGFAEFRAESERLADGILSAEQRVALRQIAGERDDPALRPAEPPPAEEAIAEPVAEQPKAERQPASPSSTPPRRRDELASEGALSFNFKQQPWGDVLRWFAERADVSLVLDSAPPGTLTYRDSRNYTPAEALDVLNGVLLTKGYTLVRKGRMLLVIDLEQDTIPPNVVTDVPLSQLDERGEYELIRVLVALGDVDPTAAADSLLRLTGPQGTVVVLPEAKMLQVTETAGRIRTMLQVVEAMRRAGQPADVSGLLVRSYNIGEMDGEVLMRVVSSVLTETSTAQIDVDAVARSLVARATLADHEVIRQTLELLSSDGRRVEVIPTERVDPLLAASLVNKLFDPNAGEDKKRDPNAPIVEADRSTESLLVRGTTEQIEQVRELVNRLDAPLAALEPGVRGPVRTIPVTEAEMERIWPQVEAMWPALGENPLRQRTTGSVIPSFRPGADVERELEQSEQQLYERLFEELLRQREASPSPPSEARQPGGRAARFRLASQPGSEPAAEPIFVSPGPGGTVIASSDPEALDAFENLLATMVDPAGDSARQYAVFYLKYANAATASNLLTAIFGGESSGSMMGDLAGAAMGEEIDLLGGLLGGGGGDFDSVSVDIVPDVRLNALYVHANPADIQTVNQLLRVIDQPRGPDRIEATGVTRLIRVWNTNAADIATVVQQVFQDRLEGSGGQAQQIDPREMMRMLAGGGNSSDEQEPERMTIGVDERSNSLVVRSSEPLFEEVKQLVDQLDQAGVERPVSTRVVSLRNTSSSALRQTLVSLLGDKAVVSTSRSEGSTNPSAPKRNSEEQKSQQNGAAKEQSAQRQNAEAQRQQIEGIRNFQRMMQRMQQGGGGRRGGGGGGPRGGGGGPPGGGFGGRGGSR